ncbi:SLOG family protein [Bacillaceae bacterium S4-13-58]
MKTLVITGYKAKELGIFSNRDLKITIIKEAFKRKLIPLVEEGLEWVLLSGQPGVELWAAEVVVNLKDVFPIKLAIIPPFKEFDQYWSDGDKEIYQFIQQQADFIQLLYQREYIGPFQFKQRDEFFIHKSDGCLVLYDEDTHGSPHYFMKQVEIMQNKGLDYKVMTITPFDLNEMAEDIVRENPDFLKGKGN